MKNFLALVTLMLCLFVTSVPDQPQRSTDSATTIEMDFAAIQAPQVTVYQFAESAPAAILVSIIKDPVASASIQSGTYQKQNRPQARLKPEADFHLRC